MNSPSLETPKKEQRLYPGNGSKGEPSIKLAHVHRRGKKQAIVFGEGVGQSELLATTPSGIFEEKRPHTV